MNEIQKLIKSFGYAFRGIGRTVKSERNMRIHICAVVFVVLFGIMQRLDPLSWAIEIILCGIVLSLELVNTAIENACDAQTVERRPEIMVSKDAAAGAVLIMAIVSVIIWLIILFRGQNLLNLKCALSSGLWATVALWAAASAVFIFYRKKK